MTQSDSDALDLNALFEELQSQQAEAALPEDHRSGFVAVVGQPNVGKSTLINRLIGQKIAIISPKPQTTRRRILGILTREDAQVIFVDTPGVHEPLHRLGEYMNEMALTAIPDADVVLFLVQAGTAPDDLDRQIASKIAHFEGPKVLVINKIDVVEQDVASARYTAYQALGKWDEMLLISATEGHGVEGVLDALIKHLPQGPRYYPEGQVTDQHERDFGAEVIREAALGYLEQEVPHALNVEVDEWKERENGMLYISATLYVERDSQKGIVIGEGGKMLKRISSQARRELERILEQKVYLELWVKVREKWRSSENWLGRWGYKPPKE
ncbi:MAG: GTPase Era [Ardenticatenales bacterium]|nr:GTPase Era [Ardenticatenales bacterium]